MTKPIEEYSDPELNVEILKLIVTEEHDDEIETYCVDGISAQVIYEVGIRGDLFNFNDWSQLMPLVVEHSVVERHDFEDKELGICWMLHTDVKGDELKRALAICLLKVLREKNKEGE